MAQRHTCVVCQMHHPPFRTQSSLPPVCALTSAPKGKTLSAWIKHRLWCTCMKISIQRHTDVWISFVLRHRLTTTLKRKVAKYSELQRLERAKHMKTIHNAEDHACRSSDQQELARGDYWLVDRQTALYSHSQVQMRLFTVVSVVRRLLRETTLYSCSQVQIELCTAAVL